MKLSKRIGDEVAELEGRLEAYDGNYRTVSRLLDKEKAENAALRKREEGLEFAARQALVAIEEGYDAPKIRDNLHEALVEEEA